MSFAILGERKGTLDAYERWRAQLVVKPDAFTIGYLAIFGAVLFAVLGDRESAYQALAHRLKQGALADVPNELFLFPMRSDPRVQTLLKDPAHNSPLPIVNWDLQKMLAELAPPH